MQNLITDRRSMALTKDTVLIIKSVAKANKLKMVDLFRTVAIILNSDEEFKDRVIRETRVRTAQEKKDREIERGEMQTLAKEVVKLPKNLQLKLSSMSADEIEKLVRKLGE